MFHKFLSKSIFFALLLIFFILPISAQERPTPTSPDGQALTTEQMQSARVVSDMSTRNRVMVSPNQTIVYRLANCDMNDRNALCYVAISASIVEDASSELFSTKPDSFSKNLLQGINRSMTLQCSVSAYSNVPGAGEMARLVQNTGVTFHTNNNNTPLKVNWGNNNGTWTGSLFRWLSMSGPNANPGWGSYAPMQARIDTTSVGQVGFYLINVWIAGSTANFGVALNINTSGWGYS